MLLLWAQNLKKAITGTVIGSKRCIDVNVANTASVPVVFSSGYLLEYRHHDAASTSINGNGGLFVELGTDPVAAALSNTITQLKVANNSGKALVFSKGANAAAAAAATPLMVVVAGQIGEAVSSVSLSSGDKIWVRAAGTTGVTSGVIVAQLFG
jgi:hypothetical protein